METVKLSSSYEVRELTDSDIDAVYELCKRNDLYYRYCPPYVTKDGICEDMKALPPGKQKKDKYYIGFYDNNSLIAVMDLISGFPDEQTAYIGFFMTDLSVQKKGTGTKIISELCDELARNGFSFVKLGWVKGNPQAEHFWKKNGFVETGAEKTTEDYTVTVAQRIL